MDEKEKCVWTRVRAQLFKAECSGEYVYDPKKYCPLCGHEIEIKQIPAEYRCSAKIDVNKSVSFVKTTIIRWSAFCAGIFM